MPAATKTTPQRAGRRRSSIGGRIVLSDRKNTPSQQMRKTPVKTKKTTPRPRRSASADSKRGRPRSNSTISTTRSSSADTKPIARRISTEPETPFGKAEAMAAAAAHMLKLKETPPPHKEDGTPFSKAEALAAAASHILTLRSRREETPQEGVKTVEFTSGPLGVEFEPEELDGDGCEVGCVVVRVHDASRYQLRPGDVLTAIDSVSTKDWPFARIVEALKTRPDPCKATFETTSVKEPSKSLFMKTPADVNREILDAKGAADLALFSTCAKIEDLQTAMPVPSTGAARARTAAMPQYDETAPKSNDSTEGAFATPLLAAELRALHDELAVAASDNVSLADALEKQRRSEREAQSKLSNALSPDKRPPQDEDLAVFAQRVAAALRRAKDELASQRSASEDLEKARRLSEEASQALRTHKAQSEQELNDLKRDCDERLQRAADMSQQAAQAFRGAVDEARHERDVVKRELLDVRSKLKEAQNDLKCTEGAYSERESALAERCDSAERRCQELDAELTTAQRDAAEWKRSAQDFEETSQIIERKVSELEATVSRQRSDSARKATQWERRCNELEDALDQSARDFETMRAESERVKEAKQALQEAIDISERELDEKLRARDRQISRLEAQLEKGASRAQKDQEHADELCRNHEKALQARDDEHRSAVAGAQKRFENKLREAHKTHATELETALQRARQEAEASRRRDAAYHERRYAAAEASHNDAMREATLAERVANRAARDASEKRLRQTIDTAVRRADDAAAERDDAQYEAERAGAAATRKALAASEAVFAKRLSDSDRAAAASTSALLAAADAKRFEALRAERAAGDASRLLAVAAATTSSDALSEARRDCEVFRQRSIAANDRAADEVRNARRAEAHAKAAEARCREAEDALDQLQRSSHAEAAQLRLESERLGLELVALQEEVDVQANGELRQCRANDQLSKNFDAIQRDRDAQKASLDLVTAEVARLTDELRRKEAQLQDADADGFRALDASARADAEAQKSKAALQAAEARVLALEKERDDLVQADRGDREALMELAQARKSRDAEFASLQAVCESLREDVKRLEAHKATSLSADTLRREAALAVAAVRAEARRELSKSDKGRIQAEEQLKKCLAELRDKDDFVRRHRAELENARARMAESDSKLVEIKKALKREVREAAEQAAEARADAEVAVASARGEALRLEDEVERLSAALRGRDDSNMEAEHLAHDLLTLSRENDALRGATEDVSSNLLRVARDADKEQKRAAMNENRARKVEAVWSRVLFFETCAPDAVDACTPPERPPTRCNPAAGDGGHGRPRRGHRARAARAGQAARERGRQESGGCGGAGPQCRRTRRGGRPRIKGGGGLSTADGASVERCGHARRRGGSPGHAPRAAAPRGRDREVEG